jgi:hypothetical protein
MVKTLKNLYILKGETWLLGINCDKDCFSSKLRLSQQAYDMIEKK